MKLFVPLMRIESYFGCNCSEGEIEFVDKNKLPLTTIQVKDISNIRPELYDRKVKVRKINPYKIQISFLDT